jgi:predicted transcriptional regulator
MVNKEQLALRALLEIQGLQALLAHPEAQELLDLRELSEQLGRAERRVRKVLKDLLE